MEGFFDVTCGNLGKNGDVPGQRTSAGGSSGPISFSSDRNGKSNVPAVPPTMLIKPTLNPAEVCPNGQWTATAVGNGVVTSATLVVTFNGQVVFGPKIEDNPRTIRLIHTIITSIFLEPSVKNHHTDLDLRMLQPRLVRNVGSS